MSNYQTRLIVQLQNTVRELERLRDVHLPRYEGCIGEPDKVVINQAKKLLHKINMEAKR